MAKKRTYRDFQELLMENLQDQHEVAAYLKAALADEDERVFLLALHDILTASKAKLTKHHPSL